ncbi:MAG: DUF2970 domain-containing protein [Pseudomonadota bacterium]
MNDQQTRTGDSPSQQEEALNLFQICGSVLAAFFGVQSSKNRERDFRAGRPMHFILMGFAMTGLLFLSLFGVVRLVLHLG